MEEKPKYGSIKAEILAVLVHELGYWKITHNLNNLMVESISLVERADSFSEERKPGKMIENILLWLCEH